LKQRTIKDGGLSPWWAYAHALVLQSFCGNQKQRPDQALDRRAEAQEEVHSFAKLYRRTRGPERKTQWLEEWHYAQRMSDIINDLIGPRYRTKLENRSHVKGASREGRAAEEIRQNRPLKAEYVE
jgi:hypothetical protein